jgi:hypothetical protein
MLAPSAVFGQTLINLIFFRRLPITKLDSVLK